MQRYAPASAVLASALGPDDAGSLFSPAAAAICQAGIARRSLLSKPRKGVESILKAATPGAGAGAGLGGSALGVFVVALFDEVKVEGLSFGFSVIFAYPLPDVGVVTVLDLPTRFSSSLFRLCTSWPSSSNLASPAAFQPSRDFGSRAFRSATWVAVIRLSASRRVFAALRSSITLLTSFRVVSSFSVLAVSDSLMAAVSVVSWSIRAKARLKDSSMEALSASSWGGVGGEIRGRT